MRSFSMDRLDARKIANGSFTGKRVHNTGKRVHKTANDILRATGFGYAAVMLLIFIILSTAVALAKGISEGSPVLPGTSSSKQSEVFSEIMVLEGDTLWSIASKNLPAGGDIRRYIYEIRTINRLESADLYPGQMLKLPKI